MLISGEQKLMELHLYYRHVSTASSALMDVSDRSLLRSIQNRYV